MVLFAYLAEITQFQEKNCQTLLEITVHSTHTDLRIVLLLIIYVKCYDSRGLVYKARTSCTSKVGNNTLRLTLTLDLIYLKSQILPNQTFMK